ncbi:MAG: hypothetical protein ACLQGV_06740 [Bryobacteraceae bacterium]
MYISPGVLGGLDDAIGKNLLGIRDSYFLWLLISSGVVVVGVFLEGPEVMHEAWGVIFRRTEDHPQRRTPCWITLLALAGWVLVALGVAGEGVSEALVSKADGTIQAFNDILLAEAQRGTAMAQRRAAEANERTARILATIADRDLNQDQQRRIAFVLRQFSGRMVYLRSYPGDGEAKRLGLEIQAALELAGIHTEDRLEQWLYDSPLVFGIEVECAAAEGGPGEERGFANAIVRALSGSGNLSVRPLSQFGCSQTVAGVNIGIRPATLAK